MPRIAQFGEKFKIFFFFTLSRPTLRIFSEIFVPRKREEQSSASRFQFPSYYLEKGQTLRKNSEGGRGAWASWTWMNFQIFVPRVRVDTWKNFAISYLEKGTRFSYLEKGRRFSYLEKGRRLGFEKLA